MTDNSNTNYQLQKTHSKLRRRRGVAEIIGTMMLMAITVVGASVLSYFVNDSFVSGSLGTSSLDTLENHVILRAYDTRDSVTLLQLSGVDNKQPSDQKLCGVACAGFPDKRPISGGTEFFVIQITNNNINSIFLSSIQLNYVKHNWDPQTAGATLNLSNDLSSGGNYPHDGKFSILKTASTKQYATNEVKGGQTVNLLIKLDRTIPNISLNKAMKVLLNIGADQPIEFLIESGNVL